MASIDSDTLLQQRKKILNVMIETIDDPIVVDKLITNTWELLREPLSVAKSKPAKKRIKVEVLSDEGQDLIEPESESESEREPIKVTPKIMLRKKSRAIQVYGKSFENIKEACKHYNKQGSYQTIVKKISAGIDPETIFSLKDAPFYRKGVH